MQVAIKVIAEVVLAPLAISTAITWVILRFVPIDAARRYAAAAGCGIGFFCGFAILETAFLKPAASWHWLPWCGAIALATGPVTLAEGVRTSERWTLHFAVALAAGLLLVPVWAALLPVRGWYIASFTAGLGVLSILLDTLAKRVSGSMMSASLCLTTLCGAVLLAIAISLRYGQLAGALSATLGGCFLAIRITSTPVDGLMRGAVPVYCVVMGGLILAGYLVPREPPVGLVFVPFAPLALWLCEFGPLSRISGKGSVLVRLAALVLPLGLATAWIARTLLTAGDDTGS